MGKEDLSWSALLKLCLSSDSECYGQWDVTLAGSVYFSHPFALNGDQVPLADSWMQTPPYAMSANSGGVAPGGDRF